MTGMVFVDPASTYNWNNVPCQGGAATREEDRQAAAGIWDVASGRQDVERHCVFSCGL